MYSFMYSNKKAVMFVFITASFSVGPERIELSTP
jgi:hypothetical protein